MLADLKPALEPPSLQCLFLVRRASSKPFSFRRYAYAFPGRTTKLQFRQSMRQTLVEGRSDAANRMRALHAIGTASNSPAALAIKSAPYSPPVDVLMVWSAPVNRVQSESICGPILSMSIGLQRLSSMHPCGLGIT